MSASSSSLGQTAKTCGNCKFMKVLRRTPTGRPMKKMACECEGVVTLIHPMSYRVTLHKSYVWPDNDATKCPTYEPK